MSNNPADMTNEDLEKDMEERNETDQTKKEVIPDEEEVIVPAEKSMDMGVEFKDEKEQDLDDLLHQQGEIEHTGNIPDPEELKFRESQ